MALSRIKVGGITGNAIKKGLPDNTVSGSAQIASNISGSFTSLSSSLSSRITSEESDFTATGISGSWRGELSSSAMTVVGGGVSGSSSSTGSFGSVSVGRAAPQPGLGFQVDKQSLIKNGLAIGANATYGGLWAGVLDVWTDVNIRNTSGTDKFTFDVSEGDFIVKGANAKISGSSTSTGSFGYLKVATNSLYVTADEKVGIGTVNPAAELHVHRDVGDAGILIDSATASDAKLKFLNGGGESWNIYSDGSETNDPLKFYDGASTAVMMTLNNGKVGIGTTGPDGPLHVHTATAGSVTAHANADELVVEGSGATGISILTADNQTGALMFGCPSDTQSARITNTQSTGIFLVGAAQTNGQVVFESGAGTEAMRVDENQNVGIGTTSPGDILHVSGAGVPQVRIGSDTLTAVTSADDLVIENLTGTSGLSILGSQTGDSHIFFGQNGNLGVGRISYEHDNNQMLFKTNGNTVALTLNSSQNAVFAGTVNVPEYVNHDGDTDTHIRFAAADSIEITAGGVKMMRFLEDDSQDMVVINEDSADIDFRVESDNSTHALFVQGSDGKIGIGTATPSKLLHVEGDALVTGTLTAQEFHTEFVSASINYTSGSTKFGNSMDDEHQFTGSLQLSGSVGNESYIIGTNVGIGTTDPGAPLHAQGSSFPVALIERTVGSGTTGASAALSLRNTTTGNMADTFGVEMQFRVTDSGITDQALGAIHVVRDGADNNGTMNLRTYSGGTAYNRLTVDTGGKVGIGTTNPTENLTVSGSASTYIGITGGGAGHNAGILLDKSGGATNMWTINADGGSSDYLLFSDTAGNYNLALHQNGNISIGAPTAIGNFDVVKKAANNEVHLTTYSDTDAHNSVLRFTRSNRDTVGYTQTAANDVLGTLEFRGVGTGANGFNIGSGITVTQTGAAGSGYLPSKMMWRISGNSDQYTRFSMDQTETVFNDDSIDVDFRVESDNSANALFVQGSDGNVGIGNTAPEADLHIGNWQSGTGTNATLRLSEGNGGGDSAGFDMKYSGSLDTLYFTSKDGSGNFVDRMVINRDTGNIGIGTTSPDRILHVHSGSSGNNPISTDSIVIIEGNQVGNNEFIEFVTPNDHQSGFLFTDGQADGYHTYVHGGTPYHKFGSGNADRVYINASGVEVVTGNVSGSSTSTGSFGRVETNTISSINEGLNIKAPTSQDMFFYANGQHHMTLRSAGNLGVGRNGSLTSNYYSYTPTLKVEGSAPGINIYDDATHFMVLRASLDNKSEIMYDDGDTFSIGTAAEADGTSYSAKLLIDSSGKVGIGTASPEDILHVYGDTSDEIVQIENDTGAGKGLKVLAGSPTNTSGMIAEFGANNSGTIVPRLQITPTGKISGSAVSTGSFGIMNVAEGVTAGGTITANNGYVYYGTGGEYIFSNNTHLYVVSTDDINLNSAGNLHVDSGADINLDSNDGNTYFKDGGSTYALIKNGASYFNGGDVGIGVTSPAASDGSARTLQLGTNLVIQDVVGTQTMFANNAHYDGTWKQVAAGENPVAMRFGAGGQINFHIANIGSAGGTLSTWDTTDVKMSIVSGSDGTKVGIGTGTPSSQRKLHLYETNASNDIYLKIENPNAGKAAGLELLANQDSSRIHFGNSTYASQGRIYYYSPNHASQADEMEIYTSGSLAMTIDASQNTNFEKNYIVNEQGKTDIQTMSSPYYVFDKDNAKIDFGDVSHLPVYKSNYSVEALVRFNAVSGDGQMIWGDSDGNANNFVRLMLFGESSAVGRLRFDGHTASPNQYNWIVQTPQNVVQADKWHHIVAIVDRSIAANCGIWVDGVKVSDTHSNLTHHVVSHDFNNIRVGADYSNNYDFNGQIAKVRCFNKALLDDEVRELYSGQSVRYSYKDSNSTNVAHDSTATSTRTEENDVDNWTGHNSPTITSISTPTDTGTSPGGGTYSLSCVNSGGGSGGAYFYLSTTGAMTVVQGKSYRATCVYRLDNNGSGRVAFNHAHIIWNGHWNTLGTHKFDGVDIGTNTAPADDNWHTYTFDFRVPDAGESNTSTSYFFMMETNNGNNGTVIIDTLDVQRIGAVGEWDGGGITAQSWYDKSANRLTGTVSGATSHNNISSLMFGDGDSGFAEGSDDSIRVYTGGNHKWNFISDYFSANDTGAPRIVAGAGTAAAPVYGFNDDPNTGMYRTGADAIGFSTNSTLRMSIMSNGNVGIGTTNPSSTLSVHTTNGVDINSAQGGGAPRLWLYDYKNDNESANIQFHKSKSGTIGSHAVVADGTDLGRIAFYASDGNTWEASAAIKVEIDGDPGDGDVPGRMIFETTPDGSGATVERIRIENSGKVGLGTNDPTAKFHMYWPSDDEICYVESTTTTANATLFRVRSAIGGAGTAKFIVNGDGDCHNTNNEFSGISDINLKTNITDASSQWNDIKAVRVRNFELKSNVSASIDKPMIGVVAQELEASGMSGLINEVGFHESGSMVKSAKYSILYMKAVKALQEAMTRIETLETQMAQVSGSS